MKYGEWARDENKCDSEIRSKQRVVCQLWLQSQYEQGRNVYYKRAHSMQNGVDLESIAIKNSGVLAPASGINRNSGI